MPTDKLTHLSEDALDAIITRVATERPWRGFWYGIFHFMRRWMVSLFTLSFCMMTEMSDAVTVLLFGTVLWADIRLRGRNAFDLRMSDREWVEFICAERVTGSRLPPWGKRFLKQLLITFGSVLLVSHLIYLVFIHGDGCTYGADACYWQTTYARGQTNMLFVVGLTLVAISSYFNPPSQFPTVHEATFPSRLNTEEFEIEKFTGKEYFFGPFSSKILFVFFIYLPAFVGFVLLPNFLFENEMLLSDWVKYSFCFIFLSTGTIAMHPDIVNFWKAQAIARRVLELAKPEDETIDS